MTSPPVEPRPWTAGRWWTTIIAVFALQAALVILLEDRSPVKPREPASVPTFRFTTKRMGELVAIEDPTLFALPHREGFSGEAWLKEPALEFRSSDWSEPPRSLPLDLQQLGASFGIFIQTSAPPSFPVIATLEPHPELTASPTVPIAPASAPSRLRMDGDLAQRRLLSALPLPSFTNTDLLTNRVVQLLVDARGNTVSAVLLVAGSGATQSEADQRALNLARAAQFEAVEPGAAKPATQSADWSIGTMIFEWQTVLEPSTNTPPPSP